MISAPGRNVDTLHITVFVRQMVFGPIDACSHIRRIVLTNVVSVFVTICIEPDFLDISVEADRALSQSSLDPCVERIIASIDRVAQLRMLV
jgi:hypothetical protein